MRIQFCSLIHNYKHINYINKHAIQLLNKLSKYYAYKTFYWFAAKKSIKALYIHNKPELAVMNFSWKVNLKVVKCSAAGSIFDIRTTAGVS